jgi:hypothetical protein
MSFVFYKKAKYEKFQNQSSLWGVCYIIRLFKLNNKFIFRNSILLSSVGVSAGDHSPVEIYLFKEIARLFPLETSASVLLPK